MSSPSSLRKYLWRRREERAGKDKEGEDDRGSPSSHTPSPYLSPRPSPRLASGQGLRVSPRPSPLLSSRSAKRRRRKTPWPLPSFLRRKLDRNTGRVASTKPHGTLESVPIVSRAFQEPFTYKQPYLHSFGDPLRKSSSYIEPEIRDIEIYREPKYLDLFDPGVEVVRDPKLDQPRRTWKDKLRPLFSRNLRIFIPNKFIIGCCVLFIVLIMGIAAIVTVARLLKIPEDPRVNYPYVTTATSCGLVKGVIENGCLVFRGVRYALSPLKELRFLAAKVPSSPKHCWLGNYWANVSKPCWAYNDQGELENGFEDCLLLDVYTPKLGYENPLPVIVYIGGSSLGGDSRRSYLMGRATELTIDKNVVLVSPQIRRGFLGFMPSFVVAASTYPHTAGNQGASDLMAALTWVNHNIEHFGGDKSKVTILGHQAGAALSWPMIKRAQQKNLVQAAWLSGAVPVSPKVMWRNANRSLSKVLECQNMTCLNAVDPRTIMESIPLDWREAKGRPWLVGDGVYIPIEEELPQVPIMFGSTEQSTAEYLSRWRFRLASRGNIEDAVHETLRQIIEFNPAPLEGPLPIRSPSYRPPQPPKPFDANCSSEALRQYSPLFDNPWLLLTTLITDATTTCPMLRTAASLARQWGYSHPSSRNFIPPVYAYVSTYQRASAYGGLADSLSDIEAIMGVFHPHSRSDLHFVNTIQNMFYTFVDNFSPERYFSTPAHYGIYVIEENFTIHRERRWCDYWTNWSHLVKTY